MGCGASSSTLAPEPIAGEGSDLRSIVIWGAKGLRDADVVGTSDPYCVVRVGPKGSAWAEKLRGTGRRSEQVKDSISPQWNLGFTVDIAGMKDPEIHIRVYDKDLLTDDDFLGEAVVFLDRGSLTETPIDVKLSRVKGGETGNGTLSVSAGLPKMLQDLNVKPSGFFDAVGPIGAVKSVDIKDIDMKSFSAGTGPLRLGTGPGLPAALTGIFWLTKQGPSSALASFGGPSGDGGGCSAGQMVGNRLKVRVAGDRTWSFAENGKSNTLVEALDLVYHFVFDDAVNPTRCQIYPEGRNLGFTLTADWLLDFDMELLKDGDKEFPGSVVWKRISSVLGREATSAEYALVQVIDGQGQPIEPAWTKFVEYQNSAEAGSSPGKIFYHEASK